MKPVCEIVVKIIPALRANIARELIENYNMSQAEVAEKLGVSQPAVSQYLRSIRGTQSKMLKNAFVEREMKKFCQNIAEGRKEDVFQFCDFCKLIRSNKIICPACKSNYPAMKDCSICVKCF